MNLHWYQRIKSRREDRIETPERGARRYEARARGVDRAASRSRAAGHHDIARGLDDIARADREQAARLRNPGRQERAPASRNEEPQDRATGWWSGRWREEHLVNRQPLGNPERRPARENRPVPEPRTETPKPYHQQARMDARLDPTGGPPLRIRQRRATR